MLVGKIVRPVAIVGGVRIPFARSNGAYAEQGNQDLLTAAMRGLVERFGLEGRRVDEAAAGAVIKHPQQWNLTREAAIGAGLSAQTPGADVERACASSLEAVLMLGNKIALGQIESAIAGGVDTLSDPPVTFSRHFQRLLLKSMRGKGRLQRLAPWLELRPRHLHPVLPGIAEQRSGLSMGESAELMVKHWGISRAEQDAFALESHQKAATAYASGFYDDLVRDHLGLTRDDNVRIEATLEGLAALMPAFDRSSTGTVTAGNSTPMTDGASAVLLASEDWARQHDLPVLAFLKFGKVGAIDFVARREELLMGPTYTIPRMLEGAKLSLQDFDFYEIHEAFAGQVLCTLKAWSDPAFCRQHLGLPDMLGSIDRTKLNVKGGSIALGSPFAATGTRMVATLAKILHEARAKRGLLGICTAGGMGVSAILER
jgi:acetyl-CoA C-acetyltransferase